MRASVGGRRTRGNSWPEKQHSPDGAWEAARQATGKHATQDGGAGELRQGGEFPDGLGS